VGLRLGDHRVGIEQVVQIDERIDLNPADPEQFGEARRE
jgi:hypothetical protein